MNILCVKAGNKYDEWYVNRLYWNTRQYFPESKFHCITENPEGIIPEVSIIPLPDDNLEKWWWKMWLFNEDWMNLNNCLYLDLDLVLQDKFEVLYGDLPHLLYCHWVKEGFPGNRYQRCAINSSVISWNFQTNRSEIWDYWIEHREQIMFCFRGIDNFLYNSKMRYSLYPDIAHSYNQDGKTNDQPIQLYNWNGITGQDTKPHELIREK